MRQMRSSIAVLVMLPLAACGTTTVCDCVAPSVVIFGTVTGASVQVEVDVRLGQGVCRDGISTGLSSKTGTDANGSYQVGVDLPPPGPGVCRGVRQDARGAIRYHDPARGRDDPATAQG